MSAGRDSPLFGAAGAAAKGAKDLSSFGDKIKSKLAAATPSVASSAFPSRSTSYGADFNIKFVAADDELDIDDILAAAASKRKSTKENHGTAAGGGVGVSGYDGGSGGSKSASAVSDGGTLETDKVVDPVESEGRNRSRLRRLAHCDSDSAVVLPYSVDDPASDDVTSGDAAASDDFKKPPSSIPISTDLLKQSEDKMKRNLMKVLDFQSTKTRSLDTVSLNKLLHETDDAKLANAASYSSDLQVDASSTEAGSEMEGDKEAFSPSKRTQGFFDDLQSKFQQKSKELQLSSPVNSRTIIEDLQQRWASRGSREATPTPDASNASPEGPSPGTSPPTKAGNILDDIKELLNEKREKLEEEMNKRKAARGGTFTPASEEPGVEEAPAEVLHQSPRILGRSTSPVQLPPGRSTSPIGASSASRGHSPSHRSASSKDNSPQSTLNLSEIIARVKSRSKSTDGDNVSPSRTPPVIVSAAANGIVASSASAVYSAISPDDVFTTAREPLENIMSEDESDSPLISDKATSMPEAALVEKDTTVSQPDSANQNYSQISNNEVVASVISPSSISHPPPTPLGLPMPSLFTSLSLKHRVCFVCAFLVSLLVLPIPSFIAGALFSAVVTTILWSVYLIWIVVLKPAKKDEKKKKPTEKYDDVSSLPYRSESTFPQLPSTSPTVLTGWLNVLPFPYEPENYHVAQTQCVFATLDLIDVTLTLRRPAKSNAVPKRAMPKEKVPSPSASTEETAAASDEAGVQFVDTRRYRLTGAAIELHPTGLVSKRLFSKKYPIAVILPGDEAESKATGEGGASEEAEAAPMDAAKSGCDEGRAEGGVEVDSPKLRRRKVATKDEEATDPPMGKDRREDEEKEAEVKKRSEGGEAAQRNDSIGTEELAADLGYEVVRRETFRLKTLHLFTRSCREKEEWYQKLTSAVQPREMHLTTPSRISDSRQSSPVRKTEAVSDVAQSVVFRKGTLFETLERDPSLGGDNFEGCLEDDRVEFGAVADEHGSIEDGNLEYGDYLANVTAASVDRDNSAAAAAAADPEDAQKDDGGKETTSSKSPPLKRSSTSDFPLPSTNSAASSLSRAATATTPPPPPPPPINLCSPNHFAHSSNPHLWLNALLTRLFWDFLREAKWRRLLVEKIQKKLGKMHLPHFMDELRVTEMDLGRSLPELLAAGSPYRDAHGLWVRMDVDYRGSAKMTLETKMNLMKLKRSPGGCEKGGGSSGEGGVTGGAIEMTAMDGRMDVGGEGKNDKLEACFSEDAEDSAESDSEIEDNADSLDSSQDENTTLHLQQPQGKSKKILNFIDKVASHKYFQQATEVGLIKKAMAGVSNTRLILSVCVESLVGTLALNVPPFPSDRLWWGFVEEPKLQLSVTPRIGDKEVTLTQVTEFIESRLKLELSKILVLPNMDDVVVPLLNTIHDASSGVSSTENEEA